MNLPDCPIPTQKYDRIVMAHGGGGRMTSRLIEKIFYPAFQNKWLEQAHDGATLNLPSARIAITTDSFVVDPIVLSRGKHRGLGYKRDRKRFTVLRSHSSLFIGRIYIRRRLTHRDIETDRTNHAKSGRESRCLYRHRRHQSRRTRQMRQDLHQHDRSRDRPRNIDIGLHRIKKGDAVIVTGDIGNHGICILSTRDSLGFETSIQSDTAALTQIVSNLLAGVPDVHILRDPTRGGLSSTLNEIAEGANVTIAIDENELPISSSVNAACDLLGLDPLYVANEGIMLVFLPDEYAERALQIIRSDIHGKNARIIGHVTEDRHPEVILKLSLGQTRILDMLSGEQLPRIC